MGPSALLAVIGIFVAFFVPALAAGGTAEGVANDVLGASVAAELQDFAVAFGLDDPSNELSFFASEYAFEYGRTHRALSEAFRGGTQAAERREEARRLVRELRKSWRSLRLLGERLSGEAEAPSARHLQEVAAGNATGDQQAVDNITAEEEASPVLVIVNVAVPVLFLLLSFVYLCLGRSYDFFSPLAHSRGLIAVAFTVTTMNSLLSLQGNLDGIKGNPLYLYGAQLAIVSIGVFSTLPVVAGTYEGAPKWMAVLSLIMCNWYLLSFLVDPIVIKLIFVWTETTDPTIASAQMIIFFLSIALSLMSFRHTYLVLRPTKTRYPFFTDRFNEGAKAYVSSFLKPGAEKMNIPIHMPVILIICFLGVLAFMGPAAFYITRFAISSHDAVQLLAFNIWLAIQPLFQLGGINVTLTPEEAETLVSKALASFIVAEVAVALTIFWILANVYRGYRRVFSALARGEAYQGRFAATNSPSSFHPMHGSSFAGSLIGNILTGTLVSGLVTFFFVFAILLPWTWNLIWSYRNYIMFYIILLVTKMILFRWVVPRFVIGNTGMVYRPRIWSVVFPTLSLMNLITGALSGLLRYVFAFPYFFLQAFRVDISALPVGYESWDGSFQSFLGLVLYSHSMLNPLVWMAVKEFAKLPKPSPPARKSNQVLAEEVGSPADKFQDEAIVKKMTTERLIAEEEGTPTVMIEQSSPKRAQIRWQLAMTLVRNPSLQNYRAHCLKIPSEKPGLADKLNMLKMKLFGNTAKVLPVGSAGGQFGGAPSVLCFGLCPSLLACQATKSGEIEAKPTSSSPE